MFIEQKMSFLHSLQRKPSWQLIWLVDFAVGWYVNLSVEKKWTTSFPGPSGKHCGKKVPLEKKLFNLKNVFSEMFVEISCDKRLLSPKKYTQPPGIRKLFDWNSCLTVFFKVESHWPSANEGPFCRFENSMESQQ